jgi:hypothetical protein
MGNLLNAPLRSSVQDRLWSRLKIEDINGCWEWTGHKLRGYGQIGIGRRSHGLMYTHVLAWVIDNGRNVPDGCQVCHRCDNPACCNPAHLFVGPPIANTRDMISKGRHSHGERHAKKLKNDDVFSIRELASAGMGHVKIAERFAVSRSMVGLVARKERWTHI